MGAVGDSRAIIIIKYFLHDGMVSYYNAVIMSAMASQITSLTIVYSTVQIKENTKAPRHWPLYGDFPGDRWIPRRKCQ